MNRYILEKRTRDVTVKQPYSYQRSAQATIKRDVWNQVAVSDDRGALLEYAKEMSIGDIRIIDREQPSSFDFENVLLKAS
jgi:hypothetical protein